MNVNGIGTAGYPLTGYTARKTGRSAESGAVGFMETVEEKAAQGKIQPTRMKKPLRWLA